MNEFRDAMAAALLDRDDLIVGDWLLFHADFASDAILAMPEMQAIRDYINWAIDPKCLSQDDVDAEPELPDSIIEWLVQS